MATNYKILEKYKATPGLNCSAAKPLLISAAHYQESLKHPSEDTEATIQGHWVHAAILEGVAEPWAGYVAKPEGMSFATKEGKAWRAEMQAQGLTTISQAAFTNARGMIAALRAEPVVEEVLCDLEHRESILTGNMLGVECKALLDAWDEGYILDLKTTVDASPVGFGRACQKFDYLIQGAWYSELAAAHGADRPVFNWLAVESEPPYCVAWYPLGPDELAFGQKQLRLVLERYKRAMDSGKWPGYPTVSRPIIPAWYLKSLD